MYIRCMEEHKVMIITFLGAGSTVFAKNLLGDMLLSEHLEDFTIHLYDIDALRLEDTRRMIDRMKRSLGKPNISLRSFLGEQQRQDALREASCVINAVQVGGYEPATRIDFEIPKRYGLRQTIGDTLGVGGIFRGIRTLQVMFEILKDMEKVCPKALVLNYANPLAIVTGGMLRASSVTTVGLCHSVQICVPRLLSYLDIPIDPNQTQWQIAGINHMAWLLSITFSKKDLYPEIKKRAAERPDHKDALRFKLMKHFGYYVTESSEHNAEYTPFWIKRNYPELIEQFHIPLDEYPRRCREQIQNWESMRTELIDRDAPLEHTRSYEYGAQIVESLVTGMPGRVHGNVLNKGLIPNLPDDAVVEVPCLTDRNGVQGVHVGPLPIGPAALNRSAVSVAELTIEAAVTGSRDLLYQAAMTDPHTAAELSLDDIVSLCDDMLEAHGDYCRIISND